MKQSASVNKLVNLLSWFIVLILFIIPFHAFLTVWLSSLFGHYTLLRLWKELLLVPIVIGAVYLLFIKPKLRKKFLNLWLTKFIGLYLVMLVIFSLISWNGHTAPKAVWYGLLVDSRLLIFFMAVMVIASCSDLLYRNWRKALFIPAIFVAAFAILQYLILPYDFLKHFGYGDTTISPYETINHSLNHIRVASTLRGANPLGAYLILPICALAALLFKEKKQRTNITMFGFGLFLALFFSFSRSAWIGVIIAVMLVAWFSLKSQPHKKTLGWVAAGLAIMASLLLVTLRNNLNFENYVFHTDRVSKAATSSNQGHTAAFKQASKDIIHQPLGRGVGTAGPQSVYNNKPARIAENYYLQIGQEAGIIGVALFILICAVLGKMLYDNRTDPLALALFASLIGLSIVNLLSHAWQDDTIAYIFWGLSGIALAPVIITNRLTVKNDQKIKKS